MPPAADPPALLPFLKSLKERISSLSAGMKAAAPILAISEAHDSFLVDSIAQSNKFFTAAWPADRELDEQPLVEAFIALVTAAHKFDAKLQKVFDKLVPKKTSELSFWRRYFAHAHALLYRLLPLPNESAYELLSKLPRSRPLNERRFPPKEPLQTTELKRGEIVRVLKSMAEVMKKDETVVALGDEAAAAAAAGTYPNVDLAAAKLCLVYQYELMENLGVERVNGLMQLQPAQLAQRFPDMQGQDAALCQALQTFVAACNAAPQMALQRLSQKPSDDPEARRFAPAASLDENPTLDEPTLLKLVTGINTFVESDETVQRLTEMSVSTFEELGGANERSMQQVQQKLMMQVARWQREYLESQGVPQDVGMRAIWSIPENFKPAPKKSADDKPSSTNELLQAFGSLRISVQTAFQGAMIEATKPSKKPADERRFAPKEGTLQSSGPLDRPFVLSFTRKCKEMLTSEESIELLAACDSVSAIGTVSVQWQRELLEHLGVDMDHGCRALGEVPARFHSDGEVLEAFRAFQMACNSSCQDAQKKLEAKTNKPLVPGERRFAPKEGTLQSDGPLDRPFVLSFTRKCKEMLISEESTELLAACDTLDDIGRLSVQWQRELLEHLGVEMNHGCQALGEVPGRFSDDRKVLEAFHEFQMACQSSCQDAMKKKSKMASAKKGDAAADIS